MSEGRIAGKIALVTGAAGGIGAAIVRRFAKEGARTNAPHLNCAPVRDSRQRGVRVVRSVRTVRIIVAPHRLDRSTGADADRSRGRRQYERGKWYRPP